MTEQLRVKRAEGFRGELRVPGDKSISHRALILGSLAEGTTHIQGLLQGADPLATLNIMRALGVPIERTGRDVRVQGVGLWGLQEPETVLPAENAGTAMRLLLGVLAPQSFYSVLTGDSSLRSRPMGRVINPLRMMEARIAGRCENTRAPISVLPVPEEGLRGIEYEQTVASAQVKSCLLLAGLYARGTTTVVEPHPSRDHTERMLELFGVEVGGEGLTITVAEQKNSPQGTEVKVPADMSSAAFLLVAGAAAPDMQLTLRDVGLNPTRDGILEVLERMGAKLHLHNRRRWGKEPVADITVRSSELKGIEIAGSLVTRSIDEIPAIAVAAAAATGTTRIRDAEELRIKESDRLSATALELGKLGADIEETSDGLIIEGSAPLRGAVCSGHGDHRVAMALAVAGLLAEGETVVEGAECAAVSFPGFADIIGELAG